ncbi:hypothetical protein [Cedecea sp.]|jgi:hypothetical protein|uniref:hypothetical protein n=1 Tax=Cedecea sp. TaxID=1970739 RepID=UPI002F4174C7
MSKSIERQQFEDAWVNDNSSTPSESERVRDALKRIWIVNDSGEGAYFDSFVMLAWTWWHKSREALAVELPPISDVETDYSDQGYNICHRSVQEKLQEQGLKFHVQGDIIWAEENGDINE